jgi:hypothetical protein
MNTTTNTPKQELHNIMVEMFNMIEDMNIQEGQYLQFADMFKQMNININRLSEIRTTIIENSYYRSHIRNTTVRRKRLTEEEKRRHPDYSICNCGRLVHKNQFIKHYKTEVHYQGLRNRKYARIGGDEEQINTLILREIVLQTFIIKHLIKTNTITDVDNPNEDENVI